MRSKLLGYVLKRLFLAAVTILLIISITFVLMHAVPSSPFNKQKALTPQVIAALEKKYGLDKPMGEQYIIYLGNILRMDFGDSIFYRGRTVLGLVGDGFKVSGRLGITAATLALSIGTVLGCFAAIKRDSALDKAIVVGTTASVALPNFVVAVLLLWLFGVVWPILPTRGDQPGGMILPIVALMLYPCAYVTRLMRSSMLDVLGQDYIRTAYAKGEPKNRVLFKHALKNAVTPIITYAGPMITFILTGSFVVEQIFSMGGLGKYFVNSIQNSDYPMIMGTTIFLAILLVTMNLICDILYTVVDKRIDLS